MPKREVVISPRAQQQLKVLIERYHAWGTRVFCGSEGADLYVCELLDELDQTVAELGLHPESFALVRDEKLAQLGYRRFLIRKQIVGIFRVDRDAVRIRGFFDPRSDYQLTLAKELRA